MGCWFIYLPYQQWVQTISIASLLLSRLSWVEMCYQSSMNLSGFDSLQLRYILSLQDVGLITNTRTNSNFCHHTGQGRREAKLHPSLLSSCVLHRLTCNLHCATRQSTGIYIAPAILYSDRRTKLRSGISAPFLPDTGARTRRYNIAASWVILYCLTPGPHVSPHPIFPFKRERAGHTHTLFLSLFHSHSLFFFFFNLFCSPFFLPCSILLFLVFLFRTRMKYVSLKTL